MKILVIWRLLTVGGVNAGWRNRAIFFKKHGIETDFLYTTDLGGIHMMQDVAKVFLTTDSKEIIPIIRDSHYDAIIVVDTKEAYGWLRGAQYAGPVIIEARTPEIIKLAPHLSDFYGIQPVQIIVPSSYQKRVVSMLCDPVPITVIHNGVDTDLFQPVSSQDSTKPLFCSRPKSKKIIGWIGRLDKRKNWKMLLKIAKLVKAERDDIEFWIIGGNKSVQKQNFSTKWHEKGLTDIVSWFPIVPYQQMPHVYSQIRESGGCTLATTRAESFGNTFIESMACGVPVVAASVSSIPEIIKHGETGRLYQENHVRGAVNQLYRLLDSQEMHQAMSQACTEHVAAHFDISICAKQYVDFLHQVVKKGGSDS
ncbi:glycosyltransferase family 1 protein [Brevibacillus laterosporus]|nr:glycosyltransferase family 4 protein [Brevibacillus laterosporus]TPG67812.1 glycosyltransferase family 1 protein [Brevibacillus laterosporus]TPG89495.1 glycosyltransferase family 1 protein [Brevibacillus laterosporus]